MPKKFIKETCSIHQTFKGNPDITCYDLNILKHIRNSLNEKFNVNIKDSNHLKSLFVNIRDFIVENTDCNKESCIINFASDPTIIHLKNYFAPIAPTEWNTKKRQFLSTMEIYDCCKQIEELDPTFKFISVTPIDFSTIVNNKCVTPDVCNLNIKELTQNNIHKFAIVFNTDPHTEPGEHWICCYGDIKKKCLYYYDSYASQPEPEIYNLFLKIQKDLGKNTKMFYNKIRHQYKHSECGMFCIYFILQMTLSKNTDFLKVTRNIPNDDIINNMRRKFFNF